MAIIVGEKITAELEGVVSIVQVCYKTGAIQVAKFQEVEQIR